MSSKRWNCTKCGKDWEYWPSPPAILDTNQHGYAEYYPACPVCLGKFNRENFGEVVEVKDEKA